MTVHPRGFCALFGKTVRHFLISLTLGAAMATQFAPAAPASEFSEPWKKSDRALVIDAYEYNSIDWEKLATDERIAGFISKASDGLPPPYACSGTETEIALCKAL